MSQTMRSF